MDMWHKDLRRKIIDIPLSRDSPPWLSSTPLPENQLADLGRRGDFVNKFEDYQIDNDLSELVSGKRIAYVCPSPHLKGMKMGEYIDSFDLVVRVNQAFHMQEENWEDYGKRTDILMNCLNCNKIAALEKDMDFARDMKFIVCPMVSMWDIQRVEDFLDVIGVPWHNVSDGYLFKIFKEVGTTCNTGLTGAMTLLNYDIKELYLTGMTFFNMNKFGQIYYDKYHNEAVANNNFREDSGKVPNFADLRIDIHQQQPQIDYFHKMVYFHYGKKMTLDKYLTENFDYTIQKVNDK